MLGTSTRRGLATLAAVIGLLAVTGPAHAGHGSIVTDNVDPDGLIVYNGHAGFGANVSGAAVRPRP